MHVKLTLFRETVGNLETVSKSCGYLYDVKASLYTEENENDDSIIILKFNELKFVTRSKFICFILVITYSFNYKTALFLNNL